MEDGHISGVSVMLHPKGTVPRRPPFLGYLSTSVRFDLSEQIRHGNICGEECVSVRSAAPNPLDGQCPTPSVPEIWGTLPTPIRMTHSNQILHGDQTRCEGKKNYVVHLAPAVDKFL